MSNRIFQIPDPLETSEINDYGTFTFSNDKTHLERVDTITFNLMFKNKAGAWSTPVDTTFTMTDTLDHQMETLGVQKSVTYDKFSRGDFRAFKMDIPEYRNYYLKASQACQVKLFNADGSKLTDISATDLRNTFNIGLEQGTYYGIVYNTMKDSLNSADNVTLRLMLTDNFVPAPVISFTDSTVIIADIQEGASIYYTLDGKDPTTASQRYTSPFKMRRNGTIKAMATFEDLSPSDVVTYTIDSYKVDQPTILFTNLKLYMSCTTPGAEIYYTLDGSDPNVNGVHYTEPVAITQNCTAKVVAKKDGYNNSDILNYVVDVAYVKCATPVATLAGNLLTLTTITDGATIYYTIDGSTPTRRSNRYAAPITLSRNCTVKAIATKTDNIDSDVMSYVVDWFQAEQPAFSYDDVNSTLSMSSSTPGAVIHYEFGGADPTEASPAYAAPLLLSDNKVIKAVTYAEGFNPSAIVAFKPRNFTCADVTFSYDGHAITMSTATDGAGIHYTLDGSSPTETSPAYQQPILLSGPCTVRAFSMKAEMNSSNLTSYEAKAYYNGGTTYTTVSGVLSSAYKWCGTNNLNRVDIIGKLNSEDIAFIKSLKSLKYLDLSKAELTDDKLVDEAFANMNLIYVSTPEKAGEIGKNLFKGNSALGAITWNFSKNVPTDLLGSTAHPNMLLYVKSASFAPAQFANTISNGISNSITLTDVASNGNFYCPESFMAKSVSYTHNFTQATTPGVSMGWETISLPFDVQIITHAVNGGCSPFEANDAINKPFWLDVFGSTGFIPSAEMKANTPYIISMPNNEQYADEYILAGKVTFSATNVEIPATTTAEGAESGTHAFRANYISQAASDTISVLNVGEEYAGHPQGSIFVMNLRGVKPFEAYITSTTPGAKVGILDLENIVTGIDRAEMYHGSDFYTRDGNLYIYSHGKKNMKLYNTAGMLFRSIWLNTGMNKITGIPAGVYLLNGKKLVIR